MCGAKWGKESGCFVGCWRGIAPIWRIQVRKLAADVFSVKARHDSSGPENDSYI